MKEASGKDWAKKNNVPYYSDMAEMNENVDFYIVLAPSNPEVHLKLCEKVFPFGKVTYVDKTFAPDAKIAQKIFDLADKYKVKMQTTSALRYTSVQEYVNNELGRKSDVKHMVAWGGGGSFGEYSIHPAELVISSMGSNIESVMRRGVGKHSQLLVNFKGGRTAVINVYTKQSTAFQASVTTGEATKHFAIDGSRIFVDMAAAFLELFETGKPNIDRKETMAIMKLLDAAKDKKALDKFIKI
jgi:predicted dehydrogenase